MITLHTNHGDIKIELDAEKAPKTVANFLNYANNDFYNNTIFHRVIPGFMIQGGGFEPGMDQKPTDLPIENEANQALLNERGTIAMARTGDPHSATAQFFINLSDNKFLNFTSESTDGWGYCAFGKVLEGMEIVDKISKVDTTIWGGHSDVPVEEVIIDKVTVA